MKTCVVIPTYNESKEIRNIVRRIRNLNLDVMVIDDGSDDDTAKISRDCGAVVLRNLKNEGKGASLIKGFDYALKQGFDAVITMDGDGQHIPENILYFFKKAEDSKKALLIGNRMSRPLNMPRIRWFTNKFMSWFISLIIGQKIPDTQCGFRLIKKDLLLKMKLKTFRYETESEILMAASKLGYRIESVPIETVYQGERSQIQPLMDTFRFIKFIVREAFNLN